ncbi:MAG TPA: formimidoylglutamase [Flavobacterium sp.]|uniref:formimidoylglutamase n=2 Tax=Flavobacterium TaxID=237 RepID=UPI0025B9363A|nr:MULTISPECIES: formimidoylglutamase [unclassified Flavobacterium]HRE78506.1 formimidoylglutamase [Flavobacterium sp.]
MAFDFLEPVEEAVLDFVKNLNSQTLGKKCVFHTHEDFPDLNKIKIAIIGVLDNRGSNSNESVDLSLIRKEFYALYPGNWHSTIADLGDIPQGNTQEDTYYAVSKIVSELIKKQIVPIVIGGSQDLTYAIYRSYDKLDQMVNLVAIDNKFDFGKDESRNTSDSYLSKIIIKEPTNLFNYSNLGFQTYYNSQEEIDLIEKLYFDAYRLGEVSTNLSLAEPVFRDSDIVSVDLTSIKSADSGNFVTFTPNGFNGKEICALSRYAGLSDKVSSFGIFNHNNLKNESVLIAQIIWYFLEGYNFRSLEYPNLNQNIFLKYIVPVDDIELIFFKSPKTERWWIEIPFISNVNNKLKKNTLLPCTHDDYLRACDQEIPERWWKAQRKNLI